jgi:two-component system sensor histidine kinase YesM
MRVEQPHRKSYALRNVYERLRLQYGSKADISLHSEPYISTSVTLTIPMTRGDE